MCLALTLSSLVGARPALAAATVYVDNGSTSCSDAGPGTEAQPYCTISAAILANKGPGVTVYVKPGVYRESVTIPASGASGNPYVLKALGGTVVIDGSDDFSSASLWTLYSGNVYRASGITWGPMQVFVDGVRLTASTAAPGSLPANTFEWVSGQGLYVNIGGANPGTHTILVGHRTKGIYLAARSYVTIDGFTVTRIDDRAIYLNTSSNYNIIRNTVCTWNYKYGIYLYGCTGVLVEKNVVSDNQDNGIMLTKSSTAGGCTACTVQDNECMRNIYPPVRRAVGIRIYASPNNLLQRNRLHDNQDSGIQIEQGSDNVVCVQNISWNNGDHGYDQLYALGVTHVGDVAYHNFKDGFSIEGQAMNGSVYDCIAIDNGLTTNEFNLWVNDSSSVGFHSDRNLFWNSTSRNPIKFITTQYATISAFSAATGNDVHSVQANPLFANVSLGDFHLMAGSPAIDAADSGVPNWPALDAEGHARGDDPATPNTGAGPVPYADMGALEFQYNHPPTAALTLTPSSGQALLSVVADGSGSRDLEGPIASYRFDFGDGTVVGPQSQSTASHTYDAGNWIATLTVTDNTGLTGSTSVPISVTGANLPPNGVINGPAANTTIYAGQAVYFSGSGNDPDNSGPLSYLWDFGGGTANQTVPEPASVIFNTVGTYTVTFTVTDALGKPDPTPDTRVITVQPAPTGQPADEIHWTFMGQTAVTFDWRGFDPTLRYGTTTSYGQTVTAVTPSPIPYSSPGPFWQARITGLTENTVYHYSIGGGPDHTFHTPPPRGTSDFIAYVEGDIGSNSMSPRMGILQSMIASARPAFVLPVGDLTYANDADQSRVDNHFNDVMTWSQDAAYMVAWGNHEWDTAGDDFRNYKGRLDLPNPQTSPGVPPVDAGGEDWYWFDYGNVRFISYPEPFPGAWRDWCNNATLLMDQAQTDPAINFIVTIGHRPAYSSGFHAGDPVLKGYLDSLGTTHSKYKLNLNGHSHDYERSYPQNGVVHITAGTGGANLEQLSNSPCPWPGGCPAPAWSAYRAFHHVAVQLHFTPTSIEIVTFCGPPGDSTSNINDVTCSQGSVVDQFIIGDQPPVVTAPATATVAENSLLTVNVTASDAEPISSLTASGLPAGATFAAGPGNTTGTLTWTPTYSQAGSYTVTFTATNTRTTSASTVITVANVDRAPVVAAPPTVTGPENGPLSVSVTASDPDGDAITSLTASGLPAGATFTAGQGNSSGTLTWTPNFSQAGSYTVTFTASNALSGSAASAFTISNVDRAPVVTAPASVGVIAGNPVTVSVRASDPDGDPITSLTADLSTTGPLSTAAAGNGDLSMPHGTITRRFTSALLSALPTGATFTADPGDTTGTLTWTPTVDQEGSYTVNFTAANALSGSASTVISVFSVPHPPAVTAPATASGRALSLITVNVTALDPDGEGITSLTANLSGLPGTPTFTAAPDNKSGTLAWTPPANAAGSSYPVTFTASNTLSGSATTTITVTSADNSPVVTAPATASVAENSPLTVSITAVDPEGDAITSLTATGLPPGATFTAGAGDTTGTLTWTPGYTQAGSYTVTFTASNAMSGSASTAITVTNVDRAPVVSAPGTVTGKAAAAMVVNVTASDPDSDAIASLTASGLPAGATFTAGPGNTTGTLNWTPASGQTGSYTVTFSAANALSGLAATAITVTVANKLPVASLVVTPSTGNAPLAVTANASASSDSDGTIASYRFDFGDGSAPVTQGTATTTHTYAAGSWTATLTVTDNDGGTKSVSAPLIVAAVPAGTNLVGNPSFEGSLGLNSWNAFASCNLTKVSGGFDGAFAAQLAATGTTTASFGINDHPDWVGPTSAPGLKYRFTAWVRSASNTGLAKLSVKEYLISTGALLGSVLTNGVRLSPTWQLITVDYTTLASGSTLDFNVKDYPVVAGETFLTDNISIYNVTGQAAPAIAGPAQAAATEVMAIRPLEPLVYPTPFRSEATLSFATSRSGPLRVEVMDLQGRRVRQLVDDSDTPAGLHQLTIQRQGGGEPLGAGIYFYRIEALEGVRTGRFVILR